MVYGAEGLLGVPLWDRGGAGGGGGGGGGGQGGGSIQERVCEIGVRVSLGLTGP